MDKELTKKIGDLASAAVKAALASGLTWDEAVAAFGVASKALAVRASGQGDGTQADCTARAMKRFKQGVDQTAAVIQAWLN